VRGRTGLRVVDVGNYIAAGDTNGVVVVTEIDPIDVEFAIPQDQVPAIGQRIVHDKAQLPVTALDRTRATVLAKGMFAALDNQVNTSTGTVKAKARFDNDAATLFPNQFVNIRLLLSTDNNAIVVPVGAVRTGPSGSFVYVFDAESSTVKMRNVKTGVSANDRIAVTDGLQAGEQVITEGGDRLTDGARVQTADQAAKAPGMRPPGSAPRHRPGPGGAGQGAWPGAASSSGGRDPSQWQRRRANADSSGGAANDAGPPGGAGGNRGGSPGQAPGP
jgi:multidrug efflux system membrane fusion protein